MLVWQFLFALFRFWPNLINFTFLFFRGPSQTFGKSTSGWQEAEKLAGIGEKKSGDYLKWNRFQSRNKKNVISLYTETSRSPPPTWAAHTLPFSHPMMIEAKQLRIILKKSRCSQPFSNCYQVMLKSRLCEFHCISWRIFGCALTRPLINTLISW